MTVMIDDSPQSNTGKRRFDTLDLACPGTRRGKVFSYYPSVANHRIQRGDIYEYRTHTQESINVIPTAEDYANLVFCSSDDEDEVEVVDAPCAKRHCKSKKRRCVSFGAFIPTVYHLNDTPLASDMTLEEKNNIWLNSKEIEEMKASANTTIQDMRELIMESHASEKKTMFRELMKKLEKDKNTSVRGLEHRVFRRRVSRQVLVEEVLECQKHIQGLNKFGHVMSNEERIMLLAHVSSKRSSVTTNTALVNAKYDSSEGYSSSEITAL